jgi:pyrroline-5-carboxylate reductase
MLITFIGGGNMASALISGLANPPRSDLGIRVVDPDATARSRLQTTFDLPVFADSEAIAAIDGADVILLAIKPQTMPVVLAQLAGHVDSSQLLLTIAAGTTIETIREKLGREIAVVRCMPNTPALIGHGITGMTAGPNCSRQQRARAEEILLARPRAIWACRRRRRNAWRRLPASAPAR